MTGYLNDLFLDNRAPPQSLHQVEVWVERYARKVEDLPVDGVDPDFLSYADDVVQRLREIVSVTQRAEQRSDLREAMIFNSGRSRYGRYGTYGYFEKGYVTRDRQVIQSDEALRGMRDSEVIVNELREISAETRRSMSQRYKIDF